MSTRLSSALEVMRDVQRDCAADAARLDRTPFTPRGVGERLGEMLAMIKAVAEGVEVVAAEIEALQRTIDSRTEHLV